LAACNAASETADGSSDVWGAGDGGGGDDAGVPDIGAACADAGTPFPCDLCAVTDPDEFAVMSVVIDANNYNPIEIRSRTRWGGSPPDLDNIPEAGVSTRADFKNKNFGGKEYCLEGDLQINCTYQYVEAATFDGMSHNGQQPLPDGGYPAPGLVLGRVGFNSDKTEALAYTGYSCGVFAAKEGSIWCVSQATRGRSSRTYSAGRPD